MLSLDMSCSALICHAEPGYAMLSLDTICMSCLAWILHSEPGYVMLSLDMSC